MKFIQLTQGQFAIVDDDLYEVLDQFEWCAFLDRSTKTYRAMRAFRLPSGIHRTMYLHHAVVGFPLNGKVVDHINGNTLDNRKINLRIISNRENCLNRRSHRAGALQGIYHHIVKRKNGSIYSRWCARIQIDGKTKCLGYFKTKEEAHERYIKELEAISQ